MTAADDLAEAIGADQRNPGPMCSVRVLLDDVDDDVRGVLLDALEDRRVKTAAIVRAVSATVDSECRVSKITVARHRRGDCHCEAAGACWFDGRTGRTG